MGAGEPQTQNLVPDTSVRGLVGTAFFAGQVRDLGEYNSRLTPPYSFQIYEKMRRSDADVAAILAACKLPIRAAEYQIVPGVEDTDPGFAAAQEVADFVEENLLGGLEYTSPAGMKVSQSFERVVENALLSLDFGCAAHENVWAVDGARVRLARAAPRLPMTFYRFLPDADGETLIALEQRGYRGDTFVTVSIPAAKLAFFSFNQEGANFWGRPILRAAYKHWYQKERLEIIECLGNEKNALGIPVFEQGLGATKEDRAAAELWLKHLAVHEQTGVSLPAGWKFVLQGVEGEVRKPLEMIRYCSEMIGRSALAMFLAYGTTQTGTRALGESSTDFFKLSLESLAWMIAETITQSSIRPLVDYNFGPQEVYPYLRFGNILATDPLKVLAVVKDLAAANVNLIEPDDEAEAWAREQLGMPKKATARVRPQITPIAPNGPNEQAAPEQPPQKALAAESLRVSASSASSADGGPRYPLNRALKPHELKHDFEAHGDRQDKTTRQVARVLRQAKPALVREAARQASQLGIQGLMRLTLPFDYSLAQRLTPLLTRAHAFGHDQVYAERKKATGRGKTVPAQSLIARDVMPAKAGIHVDPRLRGGDSHPRERGEPFLLVNRKKKPLAAHLDNPQFIAEATVTDLEGWVTRAAQTAATSLAKQGLTGQDLEGEIAGEVLALTDGALDRMGMEAARSAVGGGRGDAFGELQDEIARWIRTEAMDQNTCDPCAAGDGAEWTSYDEVDWSPGDDCEGGDACRGQLVGVFADEGQTT